jgi:yersiniabactin nonribosomal peptide synthetase
MNRMEEALCDDLSAMWEKILRVNIKSPDDDFFSLGGDSLQLVEMVVRLCAKYGVDFDYDKFFDEPKIRTLVMLLSKPSLHESDN